MNVVILDNENLTRKGVASLVSPMNDVNVIAELSSSEELFSMLRRTTVGLVIMEWRLAALDGMEALSRLIKMYPKTHVLVFSSHLTGTFPSHIWQLGVTGMISRDDAYSEFEEGVRRVLRGQRFVSAEVSKRMVNSLFVNYQESPFETLTHREMQVLMMVVDGMKIQDMADRLCISKKTVNTYRYRLFEKLGVTGEVGLTRLAMRYGVIDDMPSFDVMSQANSVGSQPLSVH